MGITALSYFLFKIQREINLATLLHTHLFHPVLYLVLIYEYIKHNISSINFLSLFTIKLHLINDYQNPVWGHIRGNILTDQSVKSVPNLEVLKPSTC